MLALVRRANSGLDSPGGDVLRGLLSSTADDPELLAQMQEVTNDSGLSVWLTILGRAIARGQALPEALQCVA